MEKGDKGSIYCISDFASVSQWDSLHRFYSLCDTHVKENHELETWLLFVDFWNSFFSERVEEE